MYVLTCRSKFIVQMTNIICCMEGEAMLLQILTCGSCPTYSYVVVKSPSSSGRKIFSSQIHPQNPSNSDLFLFLLCLFLLFVYSCLGDLERAIFSSAAYSWMKPKLELRDRLMSPIWHTVLIRPTLKIKS